MTPSLPSLSIPMPFFGVSPSIYGTLLDCRMNTSVYGFANPSGKRAKLPIHQHNKNTAYNNKRNSKLFGSAPSLMDYQ